MTTLALTIEDAAKAVGMSPDTIKRAIRATDPEMLPPPLRVLASSESPTSVESRTARSSSGAGVLLG